MTCGVFAALLALPVLASASPRKWTDDRTQVDNLTINPGPAFTCSTGGAAELLVGAAALGLVLRRRR
jgi:MYXO-CTERM domain-containing protein